MRKILLIAIILFSSVCFPSSFVVNEDTVLDIVSKRRVSIKKVPYTLLGSRDAFIANASKGLRGTKFGEEMTFYYEFRHAGQVFNIAYDVSKRQCLMSVFKRGDRSIINKLSDKQMKCYEKYLSYDEPNEENTKEFNQCTQAVAKEGESLVKPEIKNLPKEVCEELYNVEL